MHPVLLEDSWIGVVNSYGTLITLGGMAIEKIAEALGVDLGLAQHDRAEQAFLVDDDLVFQSAHQVDAKLLRRSSASLRAWPRDTSI